MPSISIFRRVILASSLVLFVSNCSESSRQAGAPIPPLDPRDSRPCYEPGVDQNAVKALTDTRVALADCRKKHDNVVRAYEGARQALGSEVEE